MKSTLLMFMIPIAITVSVPPVLAGELSAFEKQVIADMDEEDSDDGFEVIMVQNQKQSDVQAQAIMDDLVVDRTKKSSPKSTDNKDLQVTLHYVKR